MATFAKVCQLVTSCVLLKKAARRRLAFPRVSKNLKVAPIQRPPGQMAAFVSVLEAKAKGCRNGKKRISSERTCTDLGQHSNRTQEWEKKLNSKPGN